MSSGVSPTLSILDLIDGIRGFFSDFKPESRLMAINFDNKTTILGR